MKLFGTHVYPRNKYLTLQLTKSAKGVMCEDCFESLIVFSEAWWIGTKEENPEENQLEFPNDMNESKNEAPDFRGGAGATTGEAPSLKKPTKEYKVKSPSLDTESEEDTDADSYPSTGEYVKIPEATPVRHSARMAGKTLNYAEPSEHDSIASDEEKPKTEEPERAYQYDVKTDIDKLEDSVLISSRLPVDEKQREQSSSSKKLKNPKENSPHKKGSLVQATLSSLFEKAVEKKSKHSTDHSSGPKGSGAKRQRVDSIQITEQVQVKRTKKRGASSGEKSGTRTVTVKKRSQVVDDATEEISSDSPDDSDEDWAA
ncbi:uncharacterized protein A4U43_C07F22630 [Asparagus officinalis]|uniref:Uncharacterized protein n=1 Tax=Asparagus officinalis TaxID=4686 RepID=A0A5P1EHH9_ASPOF|nr:uncharacterized protein A4U43_C07F22630 [Asparagus officinalis]